MNVVESDDSSYFMEVYDRIHAVDLVLRGTDHPDTIEISPNQIQTKKSDGSVETYPLVVSVEPSSCTSVQKHTNEGVGIRLQLRDTDTLPQTSLLSTSVKRVGGEIDRLERGASQCGCRMCGLNLFVNNVKFNRVLPLPSQTWRDLFNNWSCCSHSHQGEGKGNPPAYVTGGPIEPRENDCLISDLHILVHSNKIEHRNILLRKLKYKTKEEGDSREVKCVRCRAVLGESMERDGTINAFKLNKNNIEILSLRKHAAETFVSEFFLERIVAQQLSNAVETQATHMFIVQDHQEKVHLLIRVMNTNTRLYVNNGKAANVASQEFTGNTAKTAQEFPGNTADATEDLTGNTDKATQDYTGNTDKATQDSTGNTDKATQDLTGNTAKGEIKTEIKKQKPPKYPDKTSQCHHGNGDGHKKSSEGPPIDVKNEENVRIRRDGPPCMQRTKVAQVIEMLFSFSTHLISIGRTCNEVRQADSTGCERIVKIMYASSCDPKIKGQTATWLKDDRALTMTYSSQICVQLLLVLLSSSLTMPVAHRVFGDFIVGFLRLD